MAFRNHTLLTLAMLTACAPAHADAFPDQLPSDPARPGWRPSAARAFQPAGGSHFDYDPESGALPLEDLQDDLWTVRPGTWGAGASAVPLPPPPPVTPCRPPAAVPGPLPVLGLGAAFAYSRKLRNRIK